MDLESRNINLFRRLKQLQVEQCCRHIEEQIGLWYRSLDGEEEPIKFEDTTESNATVASELTTVVAPATPNEPHGAPSPNAVIEGEAPNAVPSQPNILDSPSQLLQDPNEIVIKQEPQSQEPSDQNKLAQQPQAQPQQNQDQQQEVKPLHNKQQDHHHEESATNLNPPKVVVTPHIHRSQIDDGGDEKTIGCFLANLKYLEKFDSDATESSSSNDSYDELEDFSHEEIPPKRTNYYSYHQQQQQQQNLHHHQRSSSHHTQHQTSSAAASPSSSNLHPPSPLRRTTSQSNSVAYAGTSSANASNYDPSDLKKKAIWKWANERSRLASRWTWLQAQVADLEFRIRGQNEATVHARAYKTPPLPPTLPENSCSRTVPLNKDFRRRRLIKSSQILSDSNKRLVKFSHVPCICSSLPQTVAPCLSCNGRYNYLRQLDMENAPISERISQLDPCCHPVLSFPDDLTLGSQMSYLLKQETINRKPTKGRPGRKKGSTAANLAAAAALAAANGETNAKHPGKKGKYFSVGRPPGSTKNQSQTMITSNKLRRKYRKHSTNYDSTNQWAGANRHNHTTRRNKRVRRASSMNESSVCSESSNQYRPNHFSNNTAQGVTRRRRSEQSAYDIDNIVIPFSIAATTRVEILEYKEIMTPSWRVWENGTCQNEVKEEEVEDTSDEAYIMRHSKGESEEKKRFSLKPPKTRVDSIQCIPTSLN